LTTSLNVCIPCKCRGKQVAQPKAENRQDPEEGTFCSLSYQKLPQTRDQHARYCNHNWAFGTHRDGNSAWLTHADMVAPRGWFRQVAKSSMTLDDMQRAGYQVPPRKLRCPCTFRT